MDGIVFRDALPADLPAIVAIYNATIPGRMVTADLHPVTVEDRLAWFDAHSKDARPLWMVGDETGKILGWASFQSFYGRPAYDGTVEVSIYLDEACQGRGLGKYVLQYCIRNAPRFGISTLLGFIFDHNVPSLKLFQHFGFEEWGLLPDVAVLDGVERSLKILGKRIV